jgi:hemoglobin-like flavoprotein
MKYILAVLALVALVAMVMAEEDEHYKCGPLQKFKVKRQWDVAYGEGKHRLQFALHIFHRLFRDYPAAREPLKAFRSDNIYSPEFQALAQRILRNMNMVIDTADDPEVEKVMYEVAKATHGKYGIKPEMLPAIRDVIMESLEESLGTHLDWDSWMGCFNLVIKNLS